MSSTGSKLIALGRLLTVICIGATGVLVVLALLQQNDVSQSARDSGVAMYTSGAVAVVSAFASWVLAFVILRRTDVALDDDARGFWKKAVVLLAFVGAWCFLFRVPRVSRLHT